MSSSLLLLFHLFLQQVTLMPTQQPSIAPACIDDTLSLLLPGFSPSPYIICQEAKQALLSMGSFLKQQLEESRVIPAMGERFAAKAALAQLEAVRDLHFPPLSKIPRAAYKRGTWGKKTHLKHLSPPTHCPSKAMYAATNNHIWLWIMNI